MLSEQASASSIDIDGLICGPAFGCLAAIHIESFLLSLGIRWQKRLQLDRVDTMILQTVISSNLSGLPIGFADLGLPNWRRRPACTLSVSLSIGLSHSTASRRMIALTNLGILHKMKGGFISPVNACIHGAPDSLAEQDCVALRNLMDLMRLQGFASLSNTSTNAGTSRLGRSIIDFAVRGLEGFREQHGSITRASIWVAIIVANVRHLLNSERLLRGYAEFQQPSFDYERRPVSLRQLAREVNLPFETVRRHVLSMYQQGVVQINEQGVIVSKSAYRSQEQIARSHLHIAYLRRLLNHT